MTAKVPSPLLGYNNNVRHKGKVFHIQTEDSGVKYGHIITHLFMDGGRILKSVKTGYSEYLGNARMAEIVREMMKQQHKAMFIALRDGKFDPVVEGSADVSQLTKAVAGESPPSIPPKPSAAIVLPAIPPAPVAHTPEVPAVAAEARPVVAPSPPLPPAAPIAAPVAALTDVDNAPATIRQPPSSSPGELTLDIAALERAAGASGTSSTLHGASDLPPPPANLFRERTPGKYRMTPVPPEASPPAPPKLPSRAPPNPVASASPPPPVSRRPGPPPAPTERRYAPTRPAAIFGQARPQGKSIFGEDLISDKSLDEVILSYLAEDLEEKK